MNKKFFSISLFVMLSACSSHQTVKSDVAIKSLNDCSPVTHELSRVTECNVVLKDMDSETIIRGRLVVEMQPGTSAILACQSDSYERCRVERGKRQSRHPD